MSTFETNLHRASYLRSILVGFSCFFLGTLSDIWLKRHTMGWGMAVIDDALVGLVGSFLVLLYERRQRQNIIRKLEVIRLMNHHVRNSLQVISLAVSVPQPEQTREQLQRAVERIEWALREVLPGQPVCLSLLDRKNLPLKQMKNIPCRLSCCKRSCLLENFCQGVSE